MPKGTLTEKEKRLVAAIGRRRKSAFARFPLVFTLLGAFGLVATYYGFERVIDQTPYLRDNPWILLGTGIVILGITGGLYKKLQ